MQTEMERLPELVEAILFVAGQGVEIKDIAEKLEVDVKEIKQAIETLKEKHKDDGINIITYKNSAQMCSNSIYAEDIAVVLNPIREKQLTKAALETLAIIAYKQPITKLEIEQVRNVNSDYAMQVLTNFKLVEVVGRKDAVGKPLLYGTTEEFLKHFNLQDIDSLPDYDEILERIEIIHAESAKGDSLYGSTEIIPEDQLADAKTNQENVESDQAVDENNKKNNDAENANKENQASTETPNSTSDSLVLTEDAASTENSQINSKEEPLDENANETQTLKDSNINNHQTEEEADLEAVKNTLINANTDDEDAIIDSFKDSDIL